MPNQSYFDQSWYGLKWSNWINLKAKNNERIQIKTIPGVYRVRAKNFQKLVYIGETTNLKTRTSSLSTNSYKEMMPWNDPHTAAPNLWAWRQEQRWDYELSVAPVDFPTQKRKALECYLLWKYRLEVGESTICNHGRFHQDYLKSSDRKQNRPGRKLASNEPRNSNGGPSQRPLQSDPNFLSETWTSLDWSPFSSINVGYFPDKGGLYRITNPSQELLDYIGETANLKERMNSHRVRFKGCSVSYHVLPDGMHHYQRLELENDLIGMYFEIHQNAPLRQFNQ
jgi:hypothetical protein